MFSLDYSQLSKLVQINIKVRYRDTWLGFFWVLLNPILLYAVQAFIFSNLFKNTSSEYLVYLLTGLFPWFFLTQTAEMSCTYLKQKSLFLRNLKFTPFFMILSLVLENYINFLFSSFLVFSFLLFFKITTFFVFFSFYLASLFFFIVVLSVSYFLSYAHTLFKDVKYIIQFLFT